MGVKRLKLMAGYIPLDFLAISITAILSWQCWRHGVPWYICFGIYILVCFGIDAVITDKAKKEKDASKA